jgi:hypothetical protein
MGPNFHLEQTPDAKNAYRFQPVLWIQQSLHHDIIKGNHARNSNQDRKFYKPIIREQKTSKEKKA